MTPTFLVKKFNMDIKKPKNYADVGSGLKNVLIKVIN